MTQSLATKLYNLADKEHKTAAEKEQMARLVERLNEEMPELELAFDEETGTLNKNREEVMKNVAARMELAKQNAAMDMMTDAYKDQFEAEAELTDLKRQKASVEKEYQDLVGKDDLSNLEKKRKEVLEGNLTTLDEMIQSTTTSYINSANDVAAANDLLNQACSENGQAVQSAQQMITDAFRTSTEAMDGATTTIRDKATAFLETMNADSSTYGQDFITAWSTALTSASPEAYGSIEGFVAYVLSTMDKTPEFANLATVETGVYTQGISEGTEQAGAAADTVSDTAVSNLDKTEEAGESGKNTGQAYTEQVECEIRPASKTADKTGDEVAQNLDKSAEAGKSGKNVAQAFADSLMEGKEPARTAFDSVIENIQNGGSLLALAKDLKAQGINSIAELAAGMGEGEDSIKQRLAEVGGVSVSTIETLFNGDGTETMRSAAGNMMDVAGAELAGKSTEVLVQAGNAGLNIARGIASGIHLGAPAIQAAAQSAVNQAIAAAKAAAGIHSPSRVFRDEIGKQLVAGIAAGIELNGDLATAALEDLNSDMLESERLYNAERKRIDEERALEEEAEAREDYFKRRAEAEDRVELAEIEAEETKRLKRKAQDEELEALQEKADNERAIMDALKDDITSVYDDIAEHAQEKLGAVEDSRQSLEDKLRGASNIAETVKLSIGSYTDMADYAAQNEQKLDYINKITELRDRMNRLGYAEETIQAYMDEVQQMDMGEAMGFLRVVRGKSDEEFQKNMDAYQYGLALDKQLATSYYSDDMQRAYDESFALMEARLNELGLEIPEGFFTSGSISAERFGKAFREELDAQMAEIRSIVENYQINITPHVQLSAAAGGTVRNNTYNDNIVIYSANPTVTAQDFSNYETRRNQLLGGSDV